MLVQAPLFPVSKFVEKYFGPRFGNVFVWISLILGKQTIVYIYIFKSFFLAGQPLGVMMYYHDYVVDHFGQEEIQAFADIKTFHNVTTNVTI